jgi:type I restriction enzyme S subunit
MIYAKLEDLPLERAPLLRAGEILVVRSGAYTGDSALIDEQWAGSAPGYDLRLTPYDIEPEFLALQLLTQRCLDQINLVRLRAAQPHLNAEDLGSITVLTLGPELERQALLEIRARTSRLDSVIAELDSLRALMVELREAVVTTAISSRMVDGGNHEGR